MRIIAWLAPREWRRTHLEQMTRLEEAHRKARELEARGERVAGALGDRHRRNHWGETVAEIARGL